MYIYSNSKSKQQLLMDELYQGNRRFRTALQTSALILSSAILGEVNRSNFPIFSVYSLSEALGQAGAILFNRSESEVLFKSRSERVEKESLEKFTSEFMNLYNRFKYPCIVLLGSVSCLGHENSYGVRENAASTIVKMLQSSQWLTQKVFNDKVWFVEGAVSSWLKPIQLSLISREQVKGLAHIPVEVVSKE